MIASVSGVLKEDERRRGLISAPFNPITGEGSVGKRIKLVLSDLDLVMYLPERMYKNSFVRRLARAGSIEAFVDKYLREEYSDDVRDRTIEQLSRIRFRHDFPFWAAMLAYIKKKGGGDDVLFRLNRPQRRLVERLERMRIAGKPMRIILLKARQWGGSTCIQIYMAWLQLVHEVGLNSLIVGHINKSSAEVKDMFDKLVSRYPVEMLYEINEHYTEKSLRLENVAGDQHIHRIAQRNCKIKLGTAESPDSARGGDYNLVHCTEVGIWKKTEGKTPEEIVSAACSGVLYEPMTLIVYESTAKGTGNFFHREWVSAKKGESQFEAIFIAWFDIDQYSLSFDSDKERLEFARWIWENRNNEYAPNSRQESGKYYWWLFQKGATLEAIHWYTKERSKYSDHGYMASEYPSDDEEAFVHSGSRVFDKYKVEALRGSCRDPKVVGDVYADGEEGEDALRGVRFVEDKQGLLRIWNMPEIDPLEKMLHRYLVVVDIGGRSNKSDYSVIAVFDRSMLMDDGKPMIVAQWRGHIDIDILAWKAAQIAKLYDDALLVIESNTLETRDRDRNVDGDQSEYILNQIAGVYSNLYAREQSEADIIARAPVKYGFHTNTRTKPMIITGLNRAIRKSSYIERDQDCLDEYLCYERKQNGAYGAITGKHDDILMTRAIGLHISSKMPIPVYQKRVIRPMSTSINVVSEASL